MEEMQQLLTGLDSKYRPLVLVVAADDDLSREKAVSWFPVERPPLVLSIHRSRSVGQSYVSSVLTTLRALVDAFLLVMQTRPHLVICNGPGTCVPVCVAAKLCSRAAVVFVESFCRVRSLSLSGRLLYYVADHLIVQWPEVARRYPRATYSSLLV